MASGPELNAQIRTLLDRKTEQILAECQAEIKKHEFQANYDRRSVQQSSEIIESQQEELHCAQAEELQRRDQQRLHAQLLRQNLELREAHNKSFEEMEELKKFQSSTFDIIARRRLVEDQDTILALTGKIQELQNEINCMNDSRDFRNAGSVRSGQLPRYQSTSVFLTFSRSWRNAKPFSGNAEPQQWAAKHLGYTWCIGKRFCKSSCVLFSTLSAGIESMEFQNRGAASLIHSGTE